MKLRNPRFGNQRIAEQISHAFAVQIDKDVVRRVLATQYDPDHPGASGPSWLTHLAQTKDSLWSVDLFRCESILLRSYWVLVVIDVCTRRFVGFGIGGEYVDGPTVCRMFNHAIAGHAPPARISTDHDPLFRFHRWLANLRILEVEEIKSVPHVPMSHPFSANSKPITTELACTAPSTVTRQRIVPGILHRRRQAWRTMTAKAIAMDFSKLPSPLDWEFASHKLILLENFAWRPLHLSRRSTTEHDQTRRNPAQPNYTDASLAITPNAAFHPMVTFTIAK